MSCKRHDHEERAEPSVPAAGQTLLSGGSQTVREQRHATPMFCWRPECHATRLVRLPMKRLHRIKSYKKTLSSFLACDVARRGRAVSCPSLSVCDQLSEGFSLKSPPGTHV